MANFITNAVGKNLKNRLVELVENSKELKFLVGLLNSSLIAFWLKHKGKMQGNNYQIDKEPIIDLPIFVPSEDKQKSIRSLVEKVIEIIKSENYADNTEKKS